MFWVIAGGILLVTVVSSYYMMRPDPSERIVKPWIRLVVLFLLVGREETKKFIAKIDYVNRANKCTEEIDESIFNRDIEKLLEEEVKRVEEERLQPKPPAPRYEYEGISPKVFNKPPQLYPDHNTPRPATTPKPQKRIKQLEGDIIDLLKMVDDEDRYYKAHAYDATRKAKDYIGSVSNKYGISQSYNKYYKKSYDLYFRK